MQDTIVLIQTYIRMIWRFRWVALIVAVGVCLAGWLGVLTLPNQYQASTKVYLNTKTLLTPLLKGLAVDSSRVDDTVSVMRRTLVVRPNLEAVVRKTDMDLRAETPEQLEALVSGLAKSIVIKGTNRDNIFSIAYSNSDPKLATRVVDALLNLLVEKQLGKSRKDSTKSREFIETQIKEYETRLVAAENRLKEFKRQNVGLMPTDGSSYYSRLESITQQLAEAKLELQEANNRVAAITEQLAGVSKTFSVEQTRADGAPNPLDVRIDGLERSLDSLLLQYTEKHPDVVATLAIIGRLKAQRDAEPVTVEGEQEQAQSQNPVYQELKIGLGESQAEVAALEARVEEYQRRQLELKKLVDTVPKVEAELNRLNRDYRIDHQNYSALVKRRESLKISDDASQSTDSVQFNIIEPPREPLVPSAPNRPVLNAGVLLAGVGAGVALAFLVALFKPAVYTKEGFGEITDLPVLGVVSRVWTPGERFRRRMEVTTFALGCMCLLGIYGGLLLLESYDVNLAAKIISLRDQLV